MFSDADADIWLFVRRSLLQADGVWLSRQNALRSEFDVFVLDRLLVYVKHGTPLTRASMRCDEEGGARQFFMHVVPADSASPCADHARTSARNRALASTGEDASDSH